MLHIEDSHIRKHLMDGMFGLEKESLRVLGDGTFSHTRQPFEDSDFIVRDFCENQTEINTKPHTTAEAALQELQKHYISIQEALSGLSVREYLWPFSNPLYIRNENDIPVAAFDGEEKFKTYHPFANLPRRTGRIQQRQKGDIGKQSVHPIRQSDFRLQPADYRRDILHLRIPEDNGFHQQGAEAPLLQRRTKDVRTH